MCADPSSFPFSSDAEDGFENRIATILAETLGATLEYQWWPQGPTMISDQLREGTCDAIMGVPDGHAELLTTLAYYRSPYVFLYRSDAPFEVASLDDPVLEDLDIGVQRTGIAPHEALLKRGLAGNVTLQFGDRGYGGDEGPPISQFVRTVAAGEVDVGLAWGPGAGYYAARAEENLEVVPVRPEVDPPALSMVTPMAIAVRPGDEALRDRLNIGLATAWEEIQSVLEEFDVPRAALPRPTVTEGSR